MWWIVLVVKASWSCMHISCTHVVVLHEFCHGKMAALVLETRPEHCTQDRIIWPSLDQTISTTRYPLSSPSPAWFWWLFSCWNSRPSSFADFTWAEVLLQFSRDGSSRCDYHEKTSVTWKWSFIYSGWNVLVWQSWVFEILNSECWSPWIDLAQTFFIMASFNESHLKLGLGLATWLLRWSVIAQVAIKAYSISLPYR